MNLKETQVYYNGANSAETGKDFSFNVLVGSDMLEKVMAIHVCAEMNDEAQANLVRDGLMFLLRQHFQGSAWGDGQYTCLSDEMDTHYLSHKGKRIARVSFSEVAPTFGVYKANGLAAVIMDFKPWVMSAIDNPAQDISYVGDYDAELGKVAQRM